MSNWTFADCTCDNVGLSEHGVTMGNLQQLAMYAGKVMTKHWILGYTAVHHFQTNSKNK